MLIKLSDARESLKINKYSLDDVCAIHPVIFESVTEAAAIAIDKRDTKKEELSYVLAKQSRAIRTRMLERGKGLQKLGWNKNPSLQKSIEKLLMSTWKQKKKLIYGRV